VSVAVDSPVQAATASSQSNLTEITDPRFHGWVSVPAIDAPVTQSLWIEGWVLSRSDEPIYRIRATTGKRKWPGQYGVHRPDVKSLYPHNLDAEFSGFSIDVPLADEPFELVLQAKRGRRAWERFYEQRISPPPRARKRSLLERILRRPSVPRQVVHYDLAPLYNLWLDEPLDWARLPSRFRISGWCFSKKGEPIHGIRARVGRRHFSGNHGFFRADVAASHAEQPGTFKSGFEIDVAAPRGRVELVLEVQHSDGGWEPVFTKKISAPILNLRKPADVQLWKLGDYQTWIRRYDTISRSDRKQIHKHIASFDHRPLISVVMPVYNTSAKHLRKAIKSVQAQLYPNWELCICDDASAAPDVRRILSRYATKDERIKVVFREKNGGISIASNDALSLASGDFVALFDHDDELVLTALYFVALEINSHPDVQLLYTDEDKLSPVGQRTNAHFKPDWNPQLFLAQNYFSHLGVFRSELIKELGFRQGFEGSQDYDLVLRCSERVVPQQIRHIPRVLYHWRMAHESAAFRHGAKPYARDAAMRAVDEALKRRNVAAEVSSSGDEDFRRVRYSLPAERPRVCIVMPTRDKLELLKPCIESIFARTDYSAFELLLVDNGTTEHGAVEYLKHLTTNPRVRILRDEGEFRFGRLNNIGVQNTDAELIALLNNDLEVIEPDWLQEMVSQVTQPGVGAVGARLLYPDNRIQHAGVILGVGGVAAHAHKGLPRENHGYFARAILAQNLSTVTAACMVVRRSAYVGIGGFDEQNLRVAFNDVDLCLRLVNAGHRIVYTPYAELYHHESASRGLEDSVAKNERFETEIKYMRDRWGAQLRHDPAYNPNLSLDGTGFTLAFPPRTAKPWQDA
jgi:glycosyltransferase involved in cell wall biosynthesis